MAKSKLMEQWINQVQPKYNIAVLVSRVHNRTTLQTKEKHLELKIQADVQSSIKYPELSALSLNAESYLHMIHGTVSLQE